MIHEDLLVLLDTRNPQQHIFDFKCNEISSKHNNQHHASFTSDVDHYFKFFYHSFDNSNCH